MQLFMLLATSMSILSMLLIYRVIEGYINTGWPYTTTATAAVATGLIAILSVFFGLALRISGRNMRRFEISRFLEMKREWNKRLDDKSF
jgi:ABC-type multidrug transport system fused ATPase/permease subunit